MNDLETRIMEAHESGNTRELERLQAIYRSSELAIRPSPSPARVVGGATDGLRKSAGQSDGVRAVRFVNGMRRRYLQDLAFEAADGREGGGWLFGRAIRSSLFVDDVSNISTTLRESNRIHLDIEHANRLAQAKLSPPTGDWHIHPSGSGPSSKDKESWLGMSKALGRAYVGIIATPS